MSEITTKLSRSLFILGLVTPLALSAACGDDKEGDGDDTDTGTGTGSTGGGGDDGDGDDDGDGGDDGSSGDDGGTSGDGGTDTSGDGGSGTDTDDGGGSGTGTGGTGGTGTGDSGSSDGGSTGDTSTGDTGTGDTGTGGDGGYPDCTPSSGGPTCDGDAECVEDEVDEHDSVQGRVCAEQCEDVGDCPSAPGGDAVPLCADLSPDGFAELFCVLDCEGTDGVDGDPVDCPNGMVCGAYQIHQPPGGGNPLEWRRICIWES